MKTNKISLGISITSILQSNLNEELKSMDINKNS